MAKRGSRRALISEKSQIISNSTTQLVTVFPKMNEPIANKKIMKIFPPNKIIAKKKMLK